MTDYDGIPDSGWRNQSRDPGGVHSYDPNTRKISISNTYNEHNTKTVWMELVFAPASQPSADVRFTGGQAGGNFNNNWATCTGTNPDGSTTPGVGATGARARDGNTHFLYLWQTWTITPQPAREQIDLTNLLAKVTNGRLIHIHTITACNPSVPAPSGAAALVGGIVALSRRRRREH